MNGKAAFLLGHFTPYLAVGGRPDISEVIIGVVDDVNCRAVESTYINRSERGRITRKQSDRGCGRVKRKESSNLRGWGIAPGR